MNDALLAWCGDLHVVVVRATIAPTFDDVAVARRVIDATPLEGLSQAWLTVVDALTEWVEHAEHARVSAFVVSRSALAALTDPAPLPAWTRRADLA